MSGTTLPRAVLPADGISLAVPDHVVGQSEAAALAEEIFAPHFEDYDTLAPVFRNAGIDERWIAMPLSWYAEERGWAARTEAYLDVATDLFQDAAAQAITRAGLSGRDIDAVVTVSSTGVATPTLDARCADALGLRADCLRVPVFGLGCAGGVSGLSLSARLATGNPAMTVLLVVVELCSLAFRGDRPSKANVVATALFGDGAAAVVLSPDRSARGIGVSPGTEHRWPDTLNIMGWTVDAVGFEVIFDRAIPPFVRRYLRPVVSDAAAELGLGDESVFSRCRFHPGGRRVLEAIEAAMDLPREHLQPERRVLRAFGNMSAATILFVLNDAIRAGLRGDLLLTALGPGFTAAMVPVYMD